MTTTLAERLLLHAALHDAMTPHDDEQAAFSSDLREAAGIVAAVTENGALTTAYLAGIEAGRGGAVASRTKAPAYSLDTDPAGIDRKLACLQTLLQQLNAQTAAATVGEARDALAARPAEQQGAVDRRLTELLLSVINDVQDELGFNDEDKECSNGSAEIVAAIRELKDAARQQDGGWPTGIEQRITAAMRRIEDGHAPRRIPADPNSDVDLVLGECLALVQGRQPPFWVAAPAVGSEAIDFTRVEGNGDG